jgi:hypothetical protein
MTAHLFGATSSPGCANVGLKTTADDYETEFGSQAANFVRDNFDVDDGLKSVSTPTNAIDQIQKTKTLCKKGGFRLHKIILREPWESNGAWNLILLNFGLNWLTDHLHEEASCQH